LPAGGRYKCLEVTGPQSLRLETQPNPHNYTFDCVAGESSSQEALYAGEHGIKIRCAAAIAIGQRRCCRPQSVHETLVPLLLQLPVDRSWTTASMASTPASLRTDRRVPARRESSLESRSANTVLFTVYVIASDIQHYIA
jgi:hypothetical protein